MDAFADIKKHLRSALYDAAMDTHPYERRSEQSYRLGYLNALIEFQPDPTAFSWKTDYNEHWATLYRMGYTDGLADLNYFKDYIQLYLPNSD